MAKIEFLDNGRYITKLEIVNLRTGMIASNALYAGAGMLADAVRESIKTIHVTKDKILQGAQKLTGLQRWREAKQVADALGITRHRSEKDRHDVKIGYDGYSDYATEKYSNGVPILLIAASTEVGSEVREAQPFWRKLVTQMKPKVIERMQQSIDEDLDRLLPENKGE